MRKTRYKVCPKEIAIIFSVVNYYLNNDYVFCVWVCMGLGADMLQLTTTLGYLVMHDFITFHNSKFKNFAWYHLFRGAHVLTHTFLSLLKSLSCFA